MHAEDFPPFVERAPWRGPDLQTIRNELRPPRVDFAPYRTERLALPMRDGSGDVLIGTLHTPSGHPVARLTPAALSPAGGASTAHVASRPLVVLIHGLSGDQESPYIRQGARHFLELGHPALRLNLRGAGPSRAQCRFQYHAGRSDDLRDALLGLDPRLLSSGLILIGFSLGGNMLLKFMAEHGTAFPVVAATSVSAPIDLGVASKRIASPRNYAYARWLLGRMKLEALEKGDTLTPSERAGVLEAKTIYAFDDRFVAPRNGFASAEDYYRRCSARHFVGEIQAPTLVIHARNDPWIPVETYLEVDWKSNPRVVPLLPPSGGHVGFHDRASRVPWHLRCIERFVAGVNGGV